MDKICFEICVKFFPAAILLWDNQIQQDKPNIREAQAL